MCDIRSLHPSRAVGGGGSGLGGADVERSGGACWVPCRREVVGGLPPLGFHERGAGCRSMPGAASHAEVLRSDRCRRGELRSVKDLGQPISGRCDDDQVCAGVGERAEHLAVDDVVAVDEDEPDPLS